MIHNTADIPRRDVRTMLFCKLAPTLHGPSSASTRIHDGLYQQIIEAGREGHSPSVPGGQPQAFLTLGGYDAICVYPTNLGSDPSNWLHAVYEDKQQIIRKPSDDIIYHQMHLVSQQTDVLDIWNVSDKDYPFFLTTLVYGVNSSRLENEIKESSQKPYAIEEAEQATLCSKYEHLIRLYIRKRMHVTPFSIKYAVYNGITVSDVVIVWRAKDLQEAMELISSLEYSGIARKTLTTLGFPVECDKAKTVIECDETESVYGQVKDSVINALISNLHKSLTITVHGSIRNINEFLKIKKLMTGDPKHGLPDAPPSVTVSKIRKQVEDLVHQAVHDKAALEKLQQLRTICSAALQTVSDSFSEIPDSDELSNMIKYLSCAIPKQNWSQSLGKNDFTVSAHISYAHLANLLEIYRNYHNHFNIACWEILTDIRRNHPDSEVDWFEASKGPTPILKNLYKDFQELCTGSRRGLDLTQFPWLDAFQELLGTHNYLDRHPVLHGPSYLVYDTLKILYSYLAGKVTDYTHPDKLSHLLKRSEANIIYFIQSLDQLTEQISRNDDAMLNNRSNTHTIHFSLPESALEFYHAFLRRIVDCLIEYDRQAGLKPDNFEYDFLLSPRSSSRFRLRPMLRTDHQDHDPNSRNIWPQKQAYVLELPLENIFEPMDIFIPFVHECFHSFGDVLRNRIIRRQYMALFIATTLATAVKCGDWKHRELCAVLAREIHGITDDNTNQYLSTTWNELRKNTYQILEYSGLDTLFEKTGGTEYYLYSESILHSWHEIKQGLRTEKAEIHGIPSRPISAENIVLVNSVLNACKVYFRECYADAMMIALLALTPNEYLERTQNEIRRYQLLRTRDENNANLVIDQGIASLAQRFAVVLAACCESNIFNIAECEKAICTYGSASDRNQEHAKFSDTVMQCFRPLVYLNISGPSGASYHPPAALRHVVDYLTESISAMNSKQPTLNIPGNSPKTYTLKDLKEDFDTIIRKGNMFGQRFYTLIYEHHQEIRKKTTPTE